MLAGGGRTRCSQIADRRDRLHRGDGVGVSCECDCGEAICHYVRPGAQVRLNPVRKPEGLGGDAEGVRAELVRPRESMVERYTRCDVPDEHARRVRRRLPSRPYALATVCACPTRTR